MTITVGGTSGITFSDATQTTYHMGVFAAQSVGAVGTYALLRPTGSVAFSGLFGVGVAPGYGPVAGSGFYYSSAYAQGQSTNTSPAGSWKLISPLYSGLSGTGYASGLCYRVV
jgi:hypothetical protein